MVDGHGSVPGNELAALVFEDSYRPPFTSQNQFRKAVAVQVAPNRSTDQADLFQLSSVFGIELKLLAGAPIDPGRSRLRIPPRNHAPADKQVQISIAIDVS